MTDKEKINLFKQYMIDKGIDEETVNYNIKVVELLSSEVLYYFKESIENIDTFTFEEFTDMTEVINNKLGGREGIPKMLKGLLEMTEFLKSQRLIKGGKIAHYKKMFSNVDYYLDKYDRMTGRRDDSKEYFKDILSIRFTSEVVKIVEDVNVYDFSTLKLVDKLLNDIPVQKMEEEIDTEILREVLINLNLIEKKGNVYETSKRGRVFSRLSIEEQYAAILYMLLYRVKWEYIFNEKNSNSSFDIKEYIKIMASVFYKRNKLSILPQNLNNINQEDVLIEMASEKYRVVRAETHSDSKYIFIICFKGLGVLDRYFDTEEGMTYIVSDFGQEILKEIYKDEIYCMRSKVNVIEAKIKNKRYDEAEKHILNYILVYGGNTVMWDYLGQILLVKKSYRYAYSVLKYGYENSSKRGKTSKSILYHLVLCCKKLKLEDDINTYEAKLQHMGKA